MRILIGGGSGFVGKFLRRTLEKKGADVTLVSRSEGPNRITWRDVERNGLPHDYQAVINLAGENIMNPMKRWNSDFKFALRSSRIDTTKQLANAISQSKSRPKVWICASAVGYYPPSRTAVYTEDSVVAQNDNFLSRLSVDWENASHLPESVKDVRQVTIRLGVVLGRTGGIIQQIYLPFFFGVGGPIASGKQWFPWVHVEDVAGIFSHAVYSDAVKGVLNAVAPTQSTNSQFTAAFARALWRPAFLPVPSVVFNFIYGSDRAQAVVESRKVIPKRTLESGYKYKYPDLDSACKEFSRFIYPSEYT